MSATRIHSDQTLFRSKFFHFKVDPFVIPLGVIGRRCSLVVAPPGHIQVELARKCQNHKVQSSRGTKKNRR